MNLTAHQLVLGVALILTVASFFKPQWPLINVAVLLVIVDALALK